VPASRGRGFDLGLTGPVTPLPDPDQPESAPASTAATPPAPDPIPARPARSRRSTPPAQPRPKAATTIRLRPSAAEPLNEAWLAERQATDPKLSYPEFASRIIQLGLAAYEKQQQRKSA